MSAQQTNRTARIERETRETKIIADIEEEILKTKKKIYNNLSPWQKDQV